MKHLLSVSIGDTGLEDALHVIASLSPFCEPPREGDLDDLPLRDLATWPKSLITAKKDGGVAWPDHRDAAGFIKTVHVNPRARPPRVSFQLPLAFEHVEDGLRWIEALPFEVCSIGKIFAYEWAKMDIEPFCFGVGHVDHGWACAFRGKGHDRLVSRRWLDYGPWRVIRRPGDLTLIQFHDLDADPATAARQALPGWERMGLSRTGGFLPVPYKFRSDVEGLYTTARRTLEIVVPPGGQVEQFQMQDACAVRSRHRVVAPDIDKPIDQIAYVFVDEGDAKAHLHEMWLRELEVWLVDGDGKRRMDLTYQSARVPPDWVTVLENHSTR
jgi:hypothetical protein